MINELLRKVGVRLVRLNGSPYQFTLANVNSLVFEELRKIAVLSSNPDGSIVIIGAHDLTSFDCISKYLGEAKARIMLFEPRNASRHKLNKNIEILGLQNCHVVPKAVHQSLTSSSLYDVDPNYLHLYPAWAEGIASFSQAHLLKSISKEHICEHQVDCSNPDKWPSEFGLDSISYLQIDAEGYDFEILKAINLHYYNPSAIMLEYVNMSIEDQQECRDYLHSNGYDTIFNGEDLLAINLASCINPQAVI
jgi:FkbM family methyltransferase